MQELETKHPETWQVLYDSQLTVQNNEIPFTSVDHAQEFANKIHKGDGGLSGITTKPDTLLQYCLTSPMLTKLSSTTDKLIGYTCIELQTHHFFISNIFYCIWIKYITHYRTACIRCTQTSLSYPHIRRYNLLL